MTTPAAPAHPRLWMNRNAVAVTAAVVAAALTAIGQFKDSTVGAEWGAWLIELAAIVLAAGVVFWLVVPRSLAGSTAVIARTALILGVLGFLSLVVFWLGLPTVLAAGAAYLAANTDRPSGRQHGFTVAALMLAGVTVVLAIIIAFVG
jgi:hypothetical protein